MNINSVKSKDDFDAKCDDLSKIIHLWGYCGFFFIAEVREREKVEKKNGRDSGWKCKERDKRESEYKSKIKESEYKRKRETMKNESIKKMRERSLKENWERLMRH